jgi:hypothetical protein
MGMFVKTPKMLAKSLKNVGRVYAREPNRVLSRGWCREMQARVADDYIRSLQWVDLALGIAAEPPPAVDGAVIAQATTGNGLRPM